MKKYKKLFGIPLLITAIFILSVFSLTSTQAAVNPGEIAFMLEPNAAITIYSFTDVDVGTTSVGYSAVNMSYPAEFQMNYNGAALSSSNKPANWTITMATGTGGTTNISVMIAAPAANGTKSNIESFLNASTFTLKTADIYPPAGSGVTVMISEQTVVKFLDINGVTHIYEFIEFEKQADKSKLTWLQSYNAARGRSFSGQQGYLATLTSIEEQMFVYNTIAQKSGWLGGTTLRYNSAGNPMIDSTANISTNIGDYTSNRNIANIWYWADGPEAGTVFYNRPVRDDTNGPVPGVFNFFSNGWTYNTYPQYKNQIQNGNEPNGDGGECCLQFAWSNKASWNDLLNNSSVAQGYYVEYDFPDGLSSSSGAATAEFPVPLTISFDAGNSEYTETISNQTVLTGSIAVQPAALKPGYLYENYGNKKFLGWFENLSDIAPFNFSDPLTPSNTQGNTKILYGKWGQYYDVSFDINNISYIGEIPKQAVVSGGNATAPLGMTIGTVYDIWNGQQFGNMKFLGWFLPGQNTSNAAPYTFDMDTVTEDIALHAEWTQYYNITFDVDNAAYAGEPPIGPQNIPGGNAAAEPDVFEEDTLYQAYGNKKFLGWYNGSEKFDFSVIIDKDTTLTAHWEQYYTVTFANTKIHDAPAQSVAESGMADEPDTSTWDDTVFTFYGWSLDSTDTYTGFNPFDFGEAINADTVLYGIWDPVIYSMIFDPNGGNWDGDITPHTHEYCPGANDPEWEDYDPSHIPPEPSRPGYNFNGWLDEDNIPPPGTETIITTSIIYYAQWTMEIYHIDYELNGGTPAAGNPVIYTVENTFPINIIDPEREGYTFLGWIVKYSHPYLSPISELVTGFSILQGVTGDISLEARWNNGNEYAVYYDLDGGAGTPENPSYYTIEEMFFIIAPAKPGYTFLGWTAEGGLSVIAPDTNFNIPLGTIGDIYITANWSEPIEYSIIYDLNGGTNGADNPFSYTINDTVIFTEPTRQDYTFIGWTAEGGLSVIVPDPNFNIPTGTIGDIYLTAYFEKEESIAIQPDPIPNETPPVSEPATTQPIPEPTTTQSIPEPTETQPVSEPDTTEPVTEPATTESIPEPTETQLVSEPDTTEPITEPVTEPSATQPPVPEPTITQPNTEPATTQPILELITTQPDQISTTETGSNSPETGDNNVPFLCTVIFAIVIIGIARIIVYRHGNIKR